MIFAFIILFTALMLSAVAAYYSIAGLTAIFAAAVIPVVIMGATLELGKVVATVWLHNNWKRINLAFKLYLIPAVLFLMLLTSMGIFGFLSKAHSDQSLVSGDAMSKVAIFDEKIATEKENIAQAKKAMEQMNAQVDQMLGRSDTERGAERAVSIRKNQTKERNELQAQIAKSQKEIQKLQEERAPLAAEFRKVEAEVGPIKYIAALLYGDNPDQNVLERAVRWVIILIVIVFDPLALCLILAGNKQLEWAKEGKGGWLYNEDESTTNVVTEPPTNAEGKALGDAQTEFIESEEDFFDRAKFAARAIDIMDEQHRAELANNELANYQPDDGPLTEDQIQQIENSVHEEMASDLAELNQSVDPEPLPVVEETENLLPDETIAKDDGPPFEGVKDENGEWVQTGPSFQQKKVLPYIKSGGDFVEYQGKSMHIAVLKSLNPELFLEEDGARASSTNFGTEFPTNPKTSDTFVRVDATPNRIFKYNGARWIEVNRGITETHLTNDYLQFLVNKIATGEYDLDMLTDNEQLAIEKFIQNQNG